MSRLSFTDGVEFDTHGPYRVTRRKDGWYFVGGGMLCPVNSYEEGYEMIRGLKERAEHRAQKEAENRANRGSAREANDNG